MTKRSGGFRNTKQRLKTARGRKMASIKWLERHINDPFVNLAKQKGFRSRAAFKLEEIDNKFDILKGSHLIIDLGCAPGGWLQVAKAKVPDAIIVGIDLLKVEDVAGVEIIQGDFTDYSTHERLMQILGSKADLILSDMGENAIGEKEIDHLRSTNLVEIAFDFVQQNIKKGGHFVTKLLRGKHEEELIRNFKQAFRKVKVFKPESSYSNSSEIYIVCIDYK
jgi:23S rRNA (uridine2552-2'-O)-methyltransferase